MVSRNSITCTSEPKRWYTDPSSSPITPAPITINFFGILPNLSAPEELTVTLSSISIFGRLDGSDPEAMTIDFALWVSFPTLTLPAVGILPIP